jgi:hypothetical protein
MPDGHKIDQMAIKYTNNFHRNTLQNFTQIGIFGLKTIHLATQIHADRGFSRPSDGAVKKRKV